MASRRQRRPITSAALPCLSADTICPFPPRLLSNAASQPSRATATPSPGGRTHDSECLRYRRISTSLSHPRCGVPHQFPRNYLRSRTLSYLRRSRSPSSFVCRNGSIYFSRHASPSPPFLFPIFLWWEDNEWKGFQGN
ncbi:hypothetical protein B0H12DRAFT_426830 [Mycena haematopus]|nr:hypothetical protein B0H12DRAFT_426830 [Mycena haematopus]